MIDTPRVGTLMMIDDSELDHILYQRIIKRSNLVDETVFFTLAEDALAYLKRADRPHIRVILLDINMPRMNGFEFLEAATAQFCDEQLDAFVFILTTSLNPEDEARAKSFDIVKGYLEKPLSPKHFELLSEIVNRS